MLKAEEKKNEKNLAEYANGQITLKAEKYKFGQYFKKYQKSFNSYKTLDFYFKKRNSTLSCSSFFA
jgi:hypothetical protein